MKPSMALSKALASMAYRWCQPCLVVLLSTPAACFAAAPCPAWQDWPYKAISALTPCDEAPVERRIGRVCTRHEWRCGDGVFQDWFAHWLSELKDPVRVQKRQGQLIFSGEEQTTAWAIFWAIDPSTEPGFALLLSRLRAQP